jgi:hypothetical protein
MRIVLLVLGSLAVLSILPACSRSRCCPCPASAPAPAASATWTAAQREAALEATFALAQARIARGADARGDAWRAYAFGTQRLAPFDAPAPLLALRRTLEDERGELERATVPAPPAAAASGEGGDAAPRLVFYDVKDLVAAMAGLGMPTVEIVGPEGTRREPPEAVLGGQLYTLLPASAGPITREPLTELETRPGVLLLRAAPPRHKAMQTYLDTLRSSWLALGPAAWRVVSAPAEGSADGLVVEVHDVSDLVVALERLGGKVDVGDPGEPPLERLHYTVSVIVGDVASAKGRVEAIARSNTAGTLIVRATKEHQRAVHDLLQSWRGGWKDRWPEAFAREAP